MPEPPSEERARRLREARALVELGRDQQAATMLERMLAEAPDDVDVVLVLTHAYIGIPDLNRALSCADRAAAAAPEASGGHRYRASILVKLGRAEEAVQAGHSAVRLSPDEPWNLYCLAGAQIESSRLDDAKGTAERLLSLAPEWSSAHDTLGRVALIQGRLAEAGGHFHKALELDPESMAAMNNLGAAFLKQGKHGEAVRFFWNALRSRPQSRPARENLNMARAGYFGRGLVLFALLLPLVVLFGDVSKGLIVGEPRAYGLFLLYILAFLGGWLAFAFVRHRALPRAVRDHLTRAWRSRSS